jgi:hypothetical protein
MRALPFGARVGSPARYQFGDHLWPAALSRQICDVLTGRVWGVPRSRRSVPDDQQDGEYYEPGNDHAEQVV